mgnify:CR=1 FL=1
MDAIINGFQFGRLIYDIFWRGDLTAVMQPARDMQLIPIVFREAEILETGVEGLAGRSRQQIGQLWYPLAVSAGVS